MNKEKLTQLIDLNLSQREIALQFNCSQCKIRYWLQKFNLKTRRKIHQCTICGETNLDNFYKDKKGNFRSRCASCENNRSIQRFQNNKKEAVKYKGGKCELCGYFKCLAALDFHHVNPIEKSKNWKQMKNWPFEKIKKELDKCKLVCSNCHAEIHYLK